MLDLTIGTKWIQDGQTPNWLAAIKNKYNVNLY